MTGLETYVRQQISVLIPEYENLELKATVSDSSYSIEFFAQINGERKQCYELADEGIVDEEKLDHALALIAQYIRNNDDYKKGCVNEIAF